jgi:hypothetical protein
MWKVNQLNVQMRDLPLTYYSISSCLMNVLHDENSHRRKFRSINLGYFFFFNYLVCEAIDTAATPGLILCNS